MANRFSLDGRIGAVKVTGERMVGDMVDVITSAGLSMSTSETTQLTLTMVDDGFRILGSGIFSAGTDSTAGTSMSYAGLALECRALEVAPRGADHVLTVTARSVGVSKLRRGKGAHIWRHLSPTQFAALAAKSAGLNFVGEASSQRKAIARPGGSQAETTWETLQRLAAECGGICFEAAGTLYFGRPTWLVDRQKVLPIEWRGRSTDGTIDELPTCRRSGDDKKNAATVSAKLRGDLGELAMPGMGFDLSGVPKFNALYIVDSVTMNLAEGTAVDVSASTRINPDKQAIQKIAKKKKKKKGK